MKLEWRTVVKDDELWGWRMYDVDEFTMFTQFLIRATVRRLLCKTKRSVKVWMFGAEVGRYKRMFYTEDDAKAWATAIVRMK